MVLQYYDSTVARGYCWLLLGGEVYKVLRLPVLPVGSTSGGGRYSSSVRSGSSTVAVPRTTTVMQ